MTYEEYTTKRKAGHIVAAVGKSEALLLIEKMPMRYRAPHVIFTWAWMLSIPVAIILAIFWAWWAGLLILIFITPAIFSGVKSAAAQHVLAHAEEDKDFFDTLVATNLLHFKETKRGKAIQPIGGDPLPADVREVLESLKSRQNKIKEDKIKQGIYLVDEHSNVVGPYDQKVILQMVRENLIDKSDLGWSEGMDEWEKLEDLLPHLK